MLNRYCRGENRNTTNSQLYSESNNRLPSLFYPPCVLWRINNKKNPTLPQNFLILILLFFFSTLSDSSLICDVTPAIIHVPRGLSGQIRSGEPAPRQPSYSINIVTAEEPPVLTSPRSAKTIEKRRRHEPDTRVTSRNPFQEEMKPHLTKQSYPRTGVNSIKRRGYFHFQLKEVHPLESISIQQAELIVCLKIIN